MALNLAEQLIRRLATEPEFRDQLKSQDQAGQRAFLDANGFRGVSPEWIQSVAHSTFKALTSPGAEKIPEADAIEAVATASAVAASAVGAPTATSPSCVSATATPTAISPSCVSATAAPATASATPESAKATKPQAKNPQAKNPRAKKPKA